MSSLYKDKKDMTLFVDIENVNGIVDMKFSSDCGKFGTMEVLDRFTLTPEELLEKLDYEKQN